MPKGLPLIATLDLLKIIKLKIKYFYIKFIIYILNPPSPPEDPPGLMKNNIQIIIKI